MGKTLSIQNVNKSFTVDGQKVDVLKDINLEVQEGEFIAIVGHSGCGKSTLLKIIAGLEKNDTGLVTVDGKEVNGPGMDRGMIFQEHRLFPWMSIEKNVQLGLKGLSKEEKTKLSDQYLELVKLSEFKKAYPSQLSGGMSQRAAIARSLVSQPEVLLLDEPLGALDLKLRKDMQQELKKIQKNTGITFIFVTHDQEEALSMSDTIVVMSHGKIQQIGTPTDIYNEPVNAFVADFIGESNIVDGVMLEDYRVSFGGQEFRCLDSGFGKNEPVDVVIRPEDVDIIAPDKGKLRGKVTSVTFMGVHNEAIVDIDGFKWMIQTTDPVTEGAYIGITLEPDAIHIMKKSEYSGLFGDYSSFSNELDELSNPGEEEDA